MPFRSELNETQCGRFIMNLARKLAVIFAALISASVAQADLITFQIDAVFPCGFLCTSESGSTFQQDTGLNPDDLPRIDVDVMTLFTIDTNAENRGSDTNAFYQFLDAAGTGVSTTIGRLTLFYSRFSLNILETPLASGCDLVTLHAFPDISVLLNMSDCYGPTPGLLTDTTLHTFATADLSSFRNFQQGNIQGPFSGEPVPCRTCWWLTGAANVPLTIASVPEPGTLALFTLGLLGLGITRKRRASSPRFSAITKRTGDQF